MQVSGDLSDESSQLANGLQSELQKHLTEGEDDNSAQHRKRRGEECLRNRCHVSPPSSCRCPTYRRSAAPHRAEGAGAGRQNRYRGSIGTSGAVAAAALLSSDASDLIL